MQTEQKLNEQATYDVKKTYLENYNDGPVFNGEIPLRLEPQKMLNFLGFELNSGVGVPAGPLLNAKYIKLYADLGFDILVYKTVRTVERECHPLPNCVYVDTHGQLKESDIGQPITEVNEMPSTIDQITITNSFGIPSMPPSIWMKDVTLANSMLNPGQLMIVSIVGTPGQTEDIADDFANCARMAKEAGAMMIEANYSCPNVCTGEGSIYSDPVVSAKVSAKIREAIGDLPFMIKVGYFDDKEQMRQVIKSNMPFIDAIAGINTIPMKVYKENGEQALPGEGRLQSGLCGAGIDDLAGEFLTDLIKIRQELDGKFAICSVGGITKPEQFVERFDSGADVAMTATGAMWDPYLAYKYHQMVN